MFDDRVLNQIERGLNGDTAHDLEYLGEIADRYQDSPRAREARRSLGAVYHRNVEPNVRLEKLRRGLQSEEVLEVFLEIEKLFGKCRYQQALKLMESLLDDIACSGWLLSNQGSFHTFDTLFEVILYSLHAPAGREHPPEQRYPMSRIYSLYAQILSEFGRIGEAREALRQAILWNPASAKIRLDYARIFYEEKDYDMFFMQTVKALEYAYEREDLATAYRYLGYYFTETERYREASLCFRMDLYFQPMDEQAKLELFYIEKKAPSVDTGFDPDAMQELCGEEGLPGGVNDLVLKTAHRCGVRAARKGDVQSATYYLNIYYSLTNDIRVLETLKYLRDQENLSKYPDKVLRNKSQKQP